MTITLTAVTSLDGFITRGGEKDILKWTSAEDKQHFSKLALSSQVIIMGRTTYEQIAPKILPDDRRLRIIMTSHPDRFLAEQLPDRREFTSATATQIATDLERRGYNKVLIAGGTRVHDAFAEAGLLDEAYITIEPLTFGTGRLFMSRARLEDIPHSLQVETLNTRGTKLLHYTFDKK